MFSIRCQHYELMAHNGGVLLGSIAILLKFQLE
jgi:hypothetical protein